jgi:tetratricopeptide (TPR) repeat protein
MNKAWIFVAVCLTGMMTACDNNSDNKEASNTVDPPYKGPEFDLLVTPVGEVNFPSSCNTKAAPLVERGVALMHNMMYTEAQFVFSMADDADPNCAMAYWGNAMVKIHPLWGDALSAEDYNHGLELTQRAQSIEGTSEREREYFRTTEAFYKESADLNMKNGFVKMATVWEDISRKMPEDMDAKAFEALFKIAISANDEERLEAGQLALDVLKEMPNHPGGHHYVIHAYDTATLAERALETANHYGQITPRVPHASHMLTHTYTRLGKWDSAIEWNNVSAESALELCIDNGEVNSHYPHAMDYLMFAHLQKGDDEAAAQIQKEMFELDIPIFEKSGQRGIAYAYTAIPARYSLERKDWETAITLVPKTPAHFPWIDADKRDIGNTHFARAMGFSRLGRPDEALADIEMLAHMVATLPAMTGYEYYKMKIDSQLLGAQAWQSFAKGDIENALSLMKKAAMQEASSENAPSNPGDILPSEELLGDMYMELSRLEEAHDAYKLSLERSPGRYNSLYGAGKTAYEMGDTDAARKYFALLIENTEGASSFRASLSDARTILESLGEK